MDGILIGLAMLVSSASPPAIFTFKLPDDAATSVYLSRGILNERSRPVWRQESSPPTQATTAKRCPKSTRIVAVVAGAFAGWMGGGIIGGYAAAKSNDDGASMLRGVMIGAPIGAVAGVVIGYRLTK